MSGDTSSDTESIVFGGGCFWCTEASYKLIRGVTDVIPGYAGGTTVNPSYEEVSGGTTGHAEVIMVTFDRKIITLDEILEVFWAIHDPTTPNRQGSDVGPQYRSIILYSGDSQKQITERSIEAVAKLWPDPIVTELAPLGEFYPAEEYHRNYFERNPSQAYCQVVINPKLKHLREQFAAKLKT